MEKNRLILSISILAGASIIGFSLYRGITERQYAIDAQKKEEYIGRRKMECYQILEKERDRENEGHFSVEGVEYFEPSVNPFDGKDYNDACRVEYKYRVSNSNGGSEIVTEYKSF